MILLLINTLVITDVSTAPYYNESCIPASCIKQGSPIQTGFRHICRNAKAAVENVLVADRSERCKQTSQRQFHEGKNRQGSKRKQMYFSDDSICYETTASQDERIGQQLQEEKEEEKSREELTESERKEQFEEAFQEKSHEIFHLPGLTYLKFTHVKIKFRFEPCKVATLVRKDVKFYCSLKYLKKFKHWNIRRDSFPVNYKRRIYNIFYGEEYFSVSDENVGDAILRIYNNLKSWAIEEQEFRQEKILRYQNGEDVELDSDDEELFLTIDERRELKHKRDMVLKRMITPTDAHLQVLPPESPKRKRRQVLYPERTRKKRRHTPEHTPDRTILKRNRRRIIPTKDSD